MTGEKRTPPVRAGGASENTRKAIREPLKDSPLSQQIQPPSDFKPERFPILSTHFFGVDAPSERRARLVGHLHDLGARPLLELLTEIVGGRDIPQPPLHGVES